MKKSSYAVLGASIAALVAAANLYAANFTVNSTADVGDFSPGDGFCDTNDSNNDGPCTLRAAIRESNATLEADVITLPAGTYTIIDEVPCDDSDNTPVGDFDIQSDVTINGAGADVTFVDGNGRDRVFDIAGGEGFLTVVLRGMTIRNGLPLECGNFLGDGGGIRNFEELALDRVVVDGNTASDGGGIANFGSLSILNSTISGNLADGNDNQEFSDGGNGGGILNETGFSPETMPIVNTTISGNSADEDGGGIYTDSGFIGLRNVTITGNRAGVEFDTGDGGGIALNNSDFGPVVEVRNSIIAGNFDDGQAVESVLTRDCFNQFGTVHSQGFNLIGVIEDESGCELNGPDGFADGVNNDQVGSETQPVDPLLGPLADNGGPTFTHALLTNSPAIDLANPAGCFSNDANTGSALLIDQRGLTRPIDGNDDGTVRCDIGAFELQPLCGNGATDEGEECDDGNVEDGDGCSAACLLEPACGNGTIDEGEECDDDNTTDGDGCSSDCANEVVPACGDGILQEGEECDGGPGCNADCTLSPFCGDGVKDAGEECDDGNNVTGDGCSATCVDESGITFLLGGFGCSLSPTAGEGASQGAATIAMAVGLLSLLLVKRARRS